MSAFEPRLSVGAACAARFHDSNKKEPSSNKAHQKSEPHEGVRDRNIFDGAITEQKCEPREMSQNVVLPPNAAALLSDALVNFTPRVNAYPIAELRGRIDSVPNLITRFA
jgi:hypothetical protein